MNEEVRLVGNGEHEEDMWQYSLRPKFFNEYVGQEEAKGNLNVYIQAAKQHWTTYCSMGHQVLVRLHWQVLLRMNWVLTFA